MKCAIYARVSTSLKVSGAMIVDLIGTPPFDWCRFDTESVPPTRIELPHYFFLGVAA